MDRANCGISEEGIDEVNPTSVVVKSKTHSFSPQEGIPWRQLENWIRNRPRIEQDWASVRKLKATAEKALLPYAARYKELEKKWKLRLEPLCGDFYSADWPRFRPLRQSREEDWSDWLAWLLETSETGLFAETLLGSCMDCNPSAFRSPKKKVQREVSTADRERRGDIIAEWNKNLITHIELKLGDQNFEKTFETGQLLRSRWSKEASWTDVILIPETSKAAWKGVAEKHPTDAIKEILWTDVVHGLRKCLWVAREPVFWQAWAWSFCCAIEARILHLQSPDQSKPGLNHLVTAARWVDILAMDPKEAKFGMKPEMKAFLKDGIRLYTDAMETVQMFQAEMQKLLKAAVEARASWQPFKKHSIKKLEWGGDNGDQHWLYTTVDGEAERGEKAQIECGLWWNAPGSTQPVVYAGLWKNEERVKFGWVNGTRGIHSFEYYDGIYLCLPVPNSVEISEPVNRLIDAVSEQIDRIIKQPETED